MSLHDLSSARLTHDRLMSLMQSTAHNYARALIVIGWAGVHQIDARQLKRFHLTHYALPYCLQKRKEE